MFALVPIFFRPNYIPCHIICFASQLLIGMRGIWKFPTTLTLAMTTVLNLRRAWSYLVGWRTWKVRKAGIFNPIGFMNL